MAGITNLRPVVMAACLAAAFCGAPAMAAKLNDADAVPHLDTQGKAGYKEFMAAGKHRSFVIAPGGAWAWKSDEAAADSATDRALQACQRQTDQPCVPYAVDDKVVFDAKAWSTLWGPYQSRAEAAKAKTGKDRGDRFFDLAIRSASGKPMKLSDLRGKVVVVHFWGSWCPPCRREMPELQKLYQELGASSGVRLVLLQMREDFSAARQWAQQQHLTLPLHDSGVKDMASDFLTLANGKTMPDRRLAVAFPTTYVLDRHGVVVFSHIGPISGWPQYLPFLLDVAAKSGK
ncbi:MAG: TlpA family protein disulfide reductase [Gammaproteobacteria bacterium]|nr:TlpA family protein disulfide reductase [Gammaproteobacteria bacterium]